MALDLARETGRSVLRDLAGEADVAGDDVRPGMLARPGMPIKLDGTLGLEEAPAPRLWAHGGEILRRLLGCPAQRVAALGREGVAR